MSLQMRPKSGGERRWYSFEGDLAHNAGDIGEKFMEALTGATSSALCQYFRVTVNELYAGFAIKMNAFRLRQEHPSWSHDRCLFEVGWKNLHPNIRVATLTLYAACVSEMQSDRVGEASIARYKDLPGSSPVDDSFSLNPTSDVAAAILEVAPDGIKKPIDLDQRY